VKKVFPYLLFLVPLIFLFFNDQFYNPLEGDEPRYLAYAHNLMDGYFADPQQPYLTNGPGYPLILAILLKFKFSIVAIKKVNLMFLFASISIFFIASNILVQHERTSLFFALLFEYYILSSNGEYFKLLTEPLTLFLICSITYLVLLGANRFRLTIAILIGFLILVKVVFAYVILVMLVVLIIRKLFFQKKETTNTFIKILVIAVFTNLPYLAYTYSLTGRLLYWSDHGGKTLYWMASPNKYELGDWIPQSLKITNNNSIVSFDSNYVIDNHKNIMNEILALPLIEQDAAFKRTAFNFILHHPTKFIANWFCSVSRLLFNRPYTFSIQHNRGNPFFFIEIPGAFFLGLLFFFSLNFIKNKNQLEIVFLYLLGLVYLFISSFSYTSFRQFYIITPVFFILFTPILFKLVQLVKSNYFEIKLNEYDRKI
jgi:hypothetical protein